MFMTIFIQKSLSPGAKLKLVIQINDPVLTEKVLNELSSEEFQNTVDINMVFQSLESENFEFLQFCNMQEDFLKSKSKSLQNFHSNPDLFLAGLRETRSRIFEASTFNASKMNFERLPLTTLMIYWAYTNKKFALIEFLFSLREKNIIACGCEILLLLQQNSENQAKYVSENIIGNLAEILSNISARGRHVGLEILILF